MIIKKFRVSLPQAMSWSEDITKFAREDLGALAAVTGLESVTPDEGTPIFSPEDIEVEITVAAPSVADMDTVLPLLREPYTELVPTEEDVSCGKTKLARVVVREMCTAPQVYDLVVEAILSRFPSARQALTVEEAIMRAYMECLPECSGET